MLMGNVDTDILLLVQADYAMVKKIIKHQWLTIMVFLPHISVN